MMHGQGESKLALQKMAESIIPAGNKGSQAQLGFSNLVSTAGGNF